MPRLLIRGAAEVLTCADAAPDMIGRQIGADVLIEDDRVVAVGRLGDERVDHVLEADGGVVTPGFVDCHTHAVFGGTRVAEYAARVAGEEPPADAPAGILGTVAATSDVPVGALVDQARPRLLEMLEHGTTTVEIKSGYALTQAGELRMLEAARRLSAELPIDIVTTYLGAHAFRPGTSREEYIEEVIETIPLIAERRLAVFCDVYCDDGYFGPPDARRILSEGKRHGLLPKVHLDAYTSTGFAATAAELNAISVDHLNYTPTRDVEQLAGAGVVGVVMPCLDFAVDHPAPVRARDLVECGLLVALATDMCPGCHTASMQLVIQHACRSGGLSVEQAIRAATLNAARALGRADEIGSLEPGKRADLLILDTPTYQDLAYRLGYNAVRSVVKNGTVVAGRQKTGASPPISVEMDAMTTGETEGLWARELL